MGRFPIRELIGEVRKLLPPDSSATAHLQGVLDEALTINDDGDALGRILDLFMFREIRGAVEQVLGIKVSNGNAG